jgi:hypothetical protein
MHNAVTRLKRNVTHNTCKNPASWQDAIEETERLLAENKERQVRLRVALRTFQENLATGRPWPTSEGPAATK